MTEMDTFICKGALGDLIHLLSVIYIRWVQTGNKGVLVIYDDGEFRKNVISTYNDIREFMLRQKYIGGFHLTTKEVVNNIKDTVDLNKWRMSPYVWKGDWNFILSMTYHIPMPLVPWISHVQKPEFSTKIVIHTTSTRNYDLFPWESILTKNDECVFVSCYEEEYDRFKHKHLVDFHKANGFDDFVNIIGSCKYFVGNQTCSLAVACALNKQCLAELYHGADIFYKSLSTYTTWFSWMSDSGSDLKNLKLKLTIEQLK